MAVFAGDPRLYLDEGPRDIARVGVVGCGLMGAGIAEVCARAGLEVVVREVNDAAASSGHERIAASLNRAAAAGKVAAADLPSTLARLTVTTELRALAGCDLVIEAATENAAVKAALFAELDAVVRRPDAILATNTSSLPVAEVARAVTRPGQVIGLHFFNPAPVQPLVELVPSLLTEPDTIVRARAFITGGLGKTAIAGPDRSGFVVNALLVPYGEYAEPQFAAPPLLRRMTAAGLLGRKSSRGFYDYQTRGAGGVHASGTAISTGNGRP
jgi:3-hydroxybutyryl-CoA dehydrogenase